MRIDKIISLILMAVMVVCTSCKDDEETFLQRSDDQISFSYLNSTKQLLVLSNGSWQITSNDPWITCSPESGMGNGKTEQAIDITVEQNDIEERSGSVTLTDGVKNLVIVINQEDGFFYMDNLKVAEAFNMYEPIVDGTIEIPYHKSKPGYKANVTTTLEGEGVEGIVAEQLTDYELEVGEGSIKVNLSGTPTKKGIINIKCDVTILAADKEVELVGQTRAKLAGEVTVKMFKLLPRLAVIDWGDYKRGTGTNGDNGDPRSFVFELADSEDGAAFRHYESSTRDWNTATSMFFTHNRFAFGNLKPNTTYWFRIIARELGPNKENSDQTVLEFTTPNEVKDPNTILYKDFDNFCVGGGFCYSAFGPKFNNGDFANKGIDPTNDDQLGAYQSIATGTTSYVELLNYANNASHNYGPVKSANVWRAYWETDKYGTNVGEADYQGWQGFWVRECTGAVVMGTGSLSGWIRTPKLLDLGDQTANITLTCHTMAYFEPYHSWGEDHTQHYIRIEGPGKIVDGGPTKAEPTGVATANSDTQITVQCSANVDAQKVPIGNSPVVTEHIVKISGATKDTRIVIASHPYGTKHYRFIIDDIKITKD